MIGISISTLVLSQSFTAMAQQELTGNSFQIDNMTFSHHTTSVNGIQLHYVIGGHGDPVVLLHGWPETWYEWRHVMPALAKNYTVIAPDLRGLGDSSKPLSGYDGKTVAEDIHQLVTKLGFKTIFLVGHDIGTQVVVFLRSCTSFGSKKISSHGAPDSWFYAFLDLKEDIWWFIFHQTPNVPEALVQGKELNIYHGFIMALHIIHLL